jgi:signal transduction histidine kinase
MIRGFGAEANQQHSTRTIRIGAGPRFERLWEITVGFTVVLVLVAATGMFGAVHVENPSLRGAIELAITMWALLAAALLYGNFKRTRARRDLVLMSALVVAAVTDFLFSAIPAMADAAVMAGGPGARLASAALVAVAFAAAARSGEEQVGGRGLAIGLCVTGAGVMVVAAGWLGDILMGSSLHSAVRELGAGRASQHPVRLGVMLISSELLLLAGMGFLFRARRGLKDGFLLAAAAYLLAASRLQYLALPVTLVDWVTPREFLRLAAYGLILTVAARQYARTRSADATRARAAERERLARDLHDGLAQDLAFIAVHSQRLDSGLGENHPVTLAARRALAASRGSIVELSAAHAPSTAAAIRGVADEIEVRFSIRVTVTVKPDDDDTDDLAPHDREHVVRIAREAMMNAVRHGGATLVDVLLNTEHESPLLRVIDNGSGIDDAAAQKPNGFGLRTMRARAHSLGGELVTRRREAGGTELELLLR